MMASTKLIQVRRLPEGAENPSVVTDEPLTSNDFCHVPAPVPQKMRVKPMMTVSIHTRGRVTRATGAYRPRRRVERSRLGPSWTSTRLATAKVARVMRVKSSGGGPRSRWPTAARPRRDQRDADHDRGDLGDGRMDCLGCVGEHRSTGSGYRCRRIGRIRRRGAEGPEVGGRLGQPGGQYIGDDDRDDDQGGDGQTRRLRPAARRAVSPSGEVGA